MLKAMGLSSGQDDKQLLDARFIAFGAALDDKMMRSRIQAKNYDL